MKRQMTLKKNLHPCFNPHAQKKHIRVHLPVAPKCNIQCNYCNRKYSCMNENRPGVTGNVLSPYQALYYIEKLYETNKDISVVGIAGPGDALANAEETFKTLSLIRERGIPVLFCLATNGLNCNEHLKEIERLRVSHVTVTMNAVRPEIGELVYGWVRDGVKIYRGREAAELLLERQLSAVENLSNLGITVKVNAILIPGINDQHLPEIAEKVSGLGASIFNVMPLYPVEDTAFEYVKAPTKEMVEEIQAECSKSIPMMMHCQRCRSDAAGFLHEGIRAEFKDILEKTAKMPLDPYEKREFVAVATTNDFVVNQHLGQADCLKIFQCDGDTYSLVDVRAMPMKGNGDRRWTDMAAILKDCKSVVVSGVGDKPRKILQQSGIAVYQTDARMGKVLPRIFKGDYRENERVFEPQPCPGPKTFGFDNPGCGTCRGC